MVQHCSTATAWGNDKVILVPDELVVGCQPVACNLLRSIMMTGVVRGLATTGLQITKLDIASVQTEQINRRLRCLNAKAVSNARYEQMDSGLES